MIKSFVYPNTAHCCCEELASASSHEYDINAYTTFGDIHRPLDCDDFLTNSSSSPWSLSSHVSTSLCNKYQALEPHLIDRSRPGRSVPLPKDHCKASCSVACYFDEASSKTRRRFLRYQEPLSPPPTLPIQSLTLPPADCDPAQLGEMVDSDSCPDFPMSHSYVHLDARYGSTHHRLPSPPLSPDWTNVKAARASYPTPSENSLFIRGIEYPTPPIENDFHYYDLNELYGQSSILLPWQQSDTIDKEHNSPKASDILLASPNPPQTLEVEDGLYTTWDYNFFPPPGSPLISSPASSDHDSDFHDCDDGFTSPPSSPCLRAVSELPMLEDEGDDHLGLSSSFEDNQHWSCGPTPSLLNESSDDCYTASIRSFPGVETDEDLIPVDLASRSWAPEHCIVIPSTPYITPTTLIPMPGSSSCIMDSLREGDARTNFGSNSLLLVDDHSTRSPFISGSSRIGAELDQLDPALVASDAELKQLLDLRSRALASEKQARMVEAQYKNIKAFWLRDVGKGSVSREGIVMDDGRTTTEEVDDYDIQRQLHQEEARMQAVLAMQAKRARKREKERVREVSALVKIKLTERGVSFKKTSPGSPARHVKDEDVDVDGICVTDGFLQDSETYDTLNGHTHRYNRSKSDKGDITTMPQLVARMILRRREARLRPLTRPRPGRSSEMLGDPRPQQHPIRLNGSSRLALSSSTDSDQFSITENDILPCIGRCRPHSPPHMDVDCHCLPG
ncbi:hypothetical protein F5887DRAFT_934220, partial [Amanita rubescens]